MPNNRVPLEKAKTQGKDLIHPERYNGRTEPKKRRKLGEPYSRMTDDEKKAWAELQYELPWLSSADRPLVRMACMWIAKMDSGDFGVSATQALSSILSKLGATPVDASKVYMQDEPEAGPEDKFFGSH